MNALFLLITANNEGRRGGRTENGRRVKYKKRSILKMTDKMMEKDIFC
jgi:hypothetical protein